VALRQQNGLSADGAAGHPQPKNYLRPCLLLLLGEEPAYGYELREKLAPMSPSPWDMGSVYRALNTMEDDGLVASSWERSAEGPRRRRYDITRAGRAVLDALAYEMSGLRDLIVEFLERYRHDLGAELTPWLLQRASEGAGSDGLARPIAAGIEPELSELQAEGGQLRLEA
jgi:DNA-binding PadR family transcriptional regulator